MQRLLQRDFYSAMEDGDFADPALIGSLPPVRALKDSNVR
jgi:hypothetical protein